MSDIASPGDVSVEEGPAQELEQRFADFVELASKAERNQVYAAGIESLIRIGSSTALGQVDLLLSEGSIRDNEVGRLVIENASKRPIEMMPKWLGAISPEVSLGRSVLDRVAKRVSDQIWGQYAATTPRDSEKAIAACAALARLTRSRAVEIDLATLFERATKSVALEPDDLTARQEDYAVARAFALHGFATDNACADLIIEDVEATLEEGAPLEPLSVGAHAIDAVHSEIRSTSDARLTELAKAADATTTVTDLDKEILQLLVASARRMRGLVSPAAQPPDDLIDRVAESGARGGGAIGLWLDAYTPPPDRAWRAVRKAIAASGRSAVAAGVGTYVKKLPTRLQVELELVACSAFVREEIDENALGVFPLAESDEDSLAAGLVALAGRVAVNNFARDRMLFVCAAAQFETAAAVTRVVRGILVPILKGNKGSAEAGLKYLDLAAGVPKAVELAERALRAAVKQHPSLRKRAERAASSAGPRLSRK